MNGTASKRKGSTGERDVVKRAREHGLTAERAYASNGRSLGMTETVDVVIDARGYQVKRRSAIATYIKPPHGTHGTIIREDHGTWLAVITLDTLFELLKGAHHAAQPPHAATHDATPV